MAIGMIALYITLKDVVGNASSQQVKYFIITEQISIQLLMDDFIVNKQEVGSVNMVMKTKESTMDLYMESLTLPLLLASKVQLVCIADHEKGVK